jgi:hypothetical protein
MKWEKKGPTTNGCLGKAYLREHRILVRVNCQKRTPHECLADAIHTLAHEIAHLGQFDDQMELQQRYRRKGTSLRAVRNSRVRWGGTEKRTNALAANVVAAFQLRREELLESWFRPSRTY